MNNGNKKVLFVSYYYPPIAGIGSLRTLKFAKYLPEHGWSPVILTPNEGSHVFFCDAHEGELPDVEVVRTGYFDVPRQLKSFFGLKPTVPVSQQAKVFDGKPPLPGIADKGLNLAKSALLYPDARIGWYRSAVREGLKAIERYRPDVIYSSSPPATAHLVARKLKKETGIPWVAELRDLWSSNHQNGHWPKWREVLESRTEYKTLSRADGIVSVSDTFINYLSSRLAVSNGNGIVIPNGFDPTDYPESPDCAEGRFIISHMGDLYDMTRDPSPIFRSIVRLINRGHIDINDLEIRFYGLPVYSRSHNGIISLARECGLESVTKVMGSVSYYDSLVQQQHSSILLVIEVLTERGKGVIPGKMFEHLGAGRPMLALVPSNGEAEHLVKQTNGGIAVDPNRNTEEIDNVLNNWYKEWKETGRVGFNGEKSVIVKMTRQVGTNRLAGFLDKVVESGR